MKSDRVPLMVDSSIYNELKQLSELSGKSVAALAREALGDWMSTIGAARMEVLTEHASGKVLALTTVEKSRAASATSH